MEDELAMLGPLPETKAALIPDEPGGGAGTGDLPPVNPDDAL